MGDQTEMQLFLTVVDQGSFSAAGRVLGQTPSSVGKRIRALEERLGVELFVRSTRKMVLTDAGRRYAEDAQDIVTRITSLEEDLREGAATLRGTVRMTAPNAFGQRFVVPLVTAFMVRHPGIEIDLMLTDKVVDLIGDGVDLAIRTGVQRDSSLIGRRIGPYLRTLCAAPAYLAAHGTPQTPLDLMEHRCLKLPSEATVSQWEFGGADGQSVRLGSGFTCNSLDALTRACQDGGGIACLPRFIAAELLLSEHLIPVLSDVSPAAPSADIVLLRPDTAITPRRVREFSEFLFDGLRRSVEQ